MSTPNRAPKRDSGSRDSRRAGPVADLVRLPLNAPAAAEQTLRATEARHSAVLDAAFDAIVTMDQHGDIVDFNRAAELIFGYTREQATGRSVAELLVPPASREAHRRGVERGLAGRLSATFDHPVEVRALRADGTEFDADLAINRVDLPTGPLYTASIRDISDEKQAEQELRTAHERYRNLVEQLPLVVYVDEMASNVPNVYTSPQTTEMLGYTPEDWRDVPGLFERILHPDDRERVLAEVDAELDRPGVSRMEYRLIARDGRTVWVRDESRAIGGSDGVPPQWQGYLLDITAQKEAQAELERLAFSDPLTGLGNRALLEQRIGGCEGCGTLALLYLDLDDFKTVNDSLGHVVGDDLLVGLSGRLREIVRASDTVVRIGGDEFGVLVPADDAVAVAERIATAFEQPFRIADHELFVTASIGIATGDDAGRILRDADLAMYEAKRTGSTYRFFEPSMREAVLKRLELLRDLSRDTLFEELYLDYQPVFRLDGGELIAVEALLRWRHRERGLVPPLDFIGLAEETGRILDVGRWVLQTACAQAGSWARRHEGAVTLSVNVSARQLRDPGFASDVEQALVAGDLAPGRLVLELTESALMTGDAVSTRNLEKLRRLGTRVAIDDFGTGYSSLSYLERLAIDGIKIDRSFVEECDRSPQGLRLIDAIARLAQTLGLWIVAEGIERSEQLEPLRSTGCDAAQGFLLSRPLAAADVERLL